MNFSALIDLLALNFFISAPLLVISAVGQWVIQFRLIPEHQVTHLRGLRCIIYSLISAYLLSLIIWISWPADPALIMYNNRISLPAVFGEFIAIPFWIIRCGYFRHYKK
ncbi:MAG: hypothetical protein QM479_01790 [Pseudomonadota bacterium]